MTESSRLDRIELLLNRNAEQQAQATDMIVAMGRQQEMAARQQVEADQRLRESINAADQRLRDSIDDVVAMVGTLAHQQQEADQRFNSWLAESQEDRRRNEQAHQAFIAEAQADRQRFDAWIAEARAERQRNDQAHQAFTESFQSLLAEIARIWQRLSA